MLGAVVGTAPSAGAQRVVTTRSVMEAVAGSPLEEYLRARQLDSTSAFRPVGARADGAMALRALAASTGAHPWRGRLAVDSGRAAIYLLRPSLGTVYNSTFPMGGNDGAVWAGRGLTVAASAGVQLLAGPLSVRLEPVVFRAQNDAFPLFDETRAADVALRDPIEPTAIDLPQRFGRGPYQRIDLGDSEIRLTVAGATVGVTNAREVWGPALDHPLLLGANAPGFLHGFIGTARPVGIGIGRLHGRVIVGRLDESEFSPSVDSLSARLASGIVLTFVPRGLSNLEIGAMRFFHRRWDAGDLPGAWRVPFEGLLFKEGRLDVDDSTSGRFLPDNQLASAFLRWRLPRAGVEAYAEYARNDASFNLRELISEPDHASAYTLGLRKALVRRDARLLVVGGELVNARFTHLHRLRPQARLYQHGYFTQGHTNRGQVLGSNAVLGGGGLSLRLDDYTPSGRDALAIERIVRLVPFGEGAPSVDQVDVMHSLRVARTRFRGPIDLTGGATVTWEQQRDFRSDAFNLRLEASARVGW
jgi:hypothetical protein